MVKASKTGGRKIGTPNKTTGELREKLKEIVLGELADIPKLINKLDPRQRLDVIIKLLPFITPRITPVEEYIEEDQKPIIEIVNLNAGEYNIDEDGNVVRLDQEKAPAEINTINRVI